MWASFFSTGDLALTDSSSTRGELLGFGWVLECGTGKGESGDLGRGRISGRGRIFEEGGFMGVGMGSGERGGETEEQK